ncbi:hypothetical protein [Kribbella deserti]|uniref:FAD:protein FMN transferase n=1 Tax=Kribbella deserti TaxID=1926257 RepID=A0ABV6QGP6_9ACTN
MTTDPFSTVSSELPRDQWGRPLITPPEGGEPVAYQRVTTFVGALEDTYHLNLWSQRMVVLGMAARRDLQLAALAISDPNDRYAKRNLNDIAKQAKDAAAGSAKATIGTALHSYTERIDKGEPLGNVPEEYVPDLNAYRAITEGLESVGIEGFCVNDGLRVGGSYDRIYRFTQEFLAAYEARHGKRLMTPDGDLVEPGDALIGDVKTGNIDLGMGKICMQLGTYANSEDYDHTVGRRTPLLGNPSREWGVVVHLPAGAGAARLVWADIASGWTVASTLARGVHDWRKRKDLAHDFASLTVTKAPEASLVDLIRAAPSYDALVALYAQNASSWTPGLTALASTRKKELGAA